jgi:hypothetical protein
MKQAYTNTIRNGGGKPLTIATGSKKASSRAKAKQQVPKCAYGSACTRKGCAFRHPPAGTSYESYHEDPKSKICLPFLAGLCSYGNKWCVWNRVYFNALALSIANLSQIWILHVTSSA